MIAEGRRRAAAVAIVGVAVTASIAIGLVRRGDGDEARCGIGFVAVRFRCLVAGAESGCPRPLESTPHGCDAPDVRPLIPATSILIGSSDWETAGSALRTIDVQTFRMDAFGGHARALGRRRRCSPCHEQRDTRRGKRLLPSARGQAAVRGRMDGGGGLREQSAATLYPWGDTGAVCRRAGVGALGRSVRRWRRWPGYRGRTSRWRLPPLGLHDLAGNVAEWVAPNENRPDVAIAKGGSWVSYRPGERFASMGSSRARRRKQRLPGGRSLCLFPVMSSPPRPD